MKLRHFVQKMKKNTLKDGLDVKKDTKRDAKSSFCCSASLLDTMLTSPHQRESSHHNRRKGETMRDEEK